MPLPSLYVAFSHKFSLLPQLASNLRSDMMGPFKKSSIDVITMSGKAQVEADIKYDK